VFIDQTTLDRWTIGERPTPSEQIPSPYRLTEVGQDADIPREFLVFDADLSTIGSVKLATEDTCTAE
jgi:hypothetical protein